MSYDHLNIGQLLFLLPNAELKQRVRNLERFYKRYVSAKTGILFNKTSLNEGLFPNYTNIYIYIHIAIWEVHAGGRNTIFLSFLVLYSLKRKNFNNMTDPKIIFNNIFIFFYRE